MKRSRRFSICPIQSLFAVFLCCGALASIAAQANPGSPVASATIDAEPVVPGPLRSFLRMAGISQEVSPDEVLPLLARQVFFLGYHSGRPTEFLTLLTRYVSQARELSKLAGSEKVIRVSNCSEAEPLLRVLGYRIREQCGQADASVATSDPERAFLTIDSGFPLTDLEQSLQGGKPFVYDYPSTSVPVIFGEDTWNKLPMPKNRDTLLDRFLENPHVSLLYWSFSRMDDPTRSTLEISPGLEKLLPFAPLLNFYGSEICIRSGAVIVPGGTAAEGTWKELVGVSPHTPNEFVLRLLEKDKGWLAVFFDSLSRVSPDQQSHFIDARSVKESYSAFRPKEATLGAARGVFRPAPGLLLLLTRLQWDSTGQIHVPGNVSVWKEMLQQTTAPEEVANWHKKVSQINSPQDLLDAMFSLAGTSGDLGSLKAYLCVSEIDRMRSPSHPLSPETVRALASKFDQFRDQYLIFTEFPALDDVSITRFVKVADSLDKLHNITLRGNAMGIFQANVGLWQIFARQHEIAAGDLNQSWQQLVGPFSNVESSAELFNAGRASLAGLLRSATGEPTRSQDEILSLLAGPAVDGAQAQKMHEELSDRMRSVLDGQRLVSLDTLMALGKGLDDLAKGATTPSRLLPLAGELQEFEMPRPIFTSNERSQWAVGVYNNHHTDLEMKTDLVKLIQDSHPKIEEARGQLSPFLRDTLVGLNYAYYESPGGQLLRNNPLLVRSHDFAGESVIGIARIWDAAQLFGAGSPAGGGAHLVGSLADLPYVLAQIEQDFIPPQHVQALIWRELAPVLLTNSIVPRWWNVSRTELHAVALYQRSGEELLGISAGNEDVRNKVISILSDRMLPQSAGIVERDLREGRSTEAISLLTPADLFYLTAEFRQRFPSETATFGPVGQELETALRKQPAELSSTRIAHDFGVPHPILAHTYALEFLNVKPFPAATGFSSRLMAESWDSTNLYWARLADEMNYSPATLNRIVPELTRRLIERIFATDNEDLEAVLRAMRETGEEFRNGKIAALSTTYHLAP